MTEITKGDCKRIVSRKRLPATKSNAFIDEYQKPSEADELQKLKSIHVVFTQKKITKFPRRTSVILPIRSNLSIKYQQKKNILISFLLSFLIMVGSYYESQVLHERNYNFTYDLNITRIIICGLACVQMSLVVLYYYNKLKIKISYKMVSQNSLIYQDISTRRSLIFEILICMIVIPPYLEFIVEFPQLSNIETLSLDEILMPLIFLRLYHAVGLFYEFSFYNSLKGRFYCDFMTVEDPLSFSMRSILKKYPIFSSFLLFCLCTLILGILLNIYERNLVRSPFVYVWNALWIISYTQSTIGYGDIVPETHLARGTVVLCAFSGVFLYSYIILIVRNNTGLTITEQKLYSEVKYMTKGIRFLKSHAILLIQCWWRLIMRRKIGLPRINNIFKFHVRLQDFSLRRLIESQEKCPTLADEIHTTARRVAVKIKGIQIHLEKVNTCFTMSTKYLNIQYSLRSKLKHFNRRIRRYHEAPARFEAHLLTVSPRERITSLFSSNVVVKKLRENAVKKLIENKIRIKSISASNATPIVSSLSSDEDFYSSNHGN